MTFMWSEKEVNTPLQARKRGCENHIVKKFRLCFTENAVAAVIIAKSFVLLYCKTFRTHQKHLYFRDFSKTLG